MNVWNRVKGKFRNSFSGQLYSRLRKDSIVPKERTIPFEDHPLCTKNVRIFFFHDAVERDADLSEAHRIQMQPAEQIAELPCEVVTASAKKNLELRVDAENGATAGKFELAKSLNPDAIHDTVHEMALNEARHGKAFEGLLNRYFSK